jgi:hypothetical protein
MPDPSIFNSNAHQMHNVFMGFAVALGLGIMLQWAYLSLVDTPEERLKRRRLSSQACA